MEEHLPTFPAFKPQTETLDEPFPPPVDITSYADEPFLPEFGASDAADALIIVSSVLSTYNMVTSCRCDARLTHARLRHGGKWRWSVARGEVLPGDAESWC